METVAFHTFLTEKLSLSYRDSNVRCISFQEWNLDVWTRIRKKRSESHVRDLFPPRPAVCPLCACDFCCCHPSGRRHEHSRYQRFVFEAFFCRQVSTRIGFQASVSFYSWEGSCTRKAESQWREKRTRTNLCKVELWFEELPWIIEWCWDFCVLCLYICILIRKLECCEFLSWLELRVSGEVPELSLAWILIVASLFQCFFSQTSFHRDSTIFAPFSSYSLQFAPQHSESVRRITTKNGKAKFSDSARNRKK